MNVHLITVKSITKQTTLRTQRLKSILELIEDIYKFPETIIFAHCNRLINIHLNIFFFCCRQF